MATLEQVQQRYTQAQKALAARKGEQARLLRDLETAKTIRQDHADKAKLYGEVAIFMNLVAETGRKQAVENIDTLVANAVKSIFGPEYSFRVDLTEKAGRAEAEFYVTSEYQGEHLETRPQDARGGGVVDVVSLGLRIAMLQTYRPALEGALILDEPGKHVSEEFIGPLAEFLKTICATFGRQVLMVTHEVALAESADVAYQVTLDGDRSVAKRLTA